MFIKSSMPTCDAVSRSTAADRSERHDVNPAGASPTTTTWLAGNSSRASARMGRNAASSATNSASLSRHCSVMQLAAGVADIHRHHHRTGCGASASQVSGNAGTFGSITATTLHPAYTPSDRNPLAQRETCSRRCA